MAGRKKKTASGEPMLILLLLLVLALMRGLGRRRATECCDQSARSYAVKHYYQRHLQHRSSCVPYWPSLHAQLFSSSSLVHEAIEMPSTMMKSTVKTMNVMKASWLRVTIRPAVMRWLQLAPDHAPIAYVRGQTCSDSACRDRPHASAACVWEISSHEEWLLPMMVLLMRVTVMIPTVMAMMCSSHWSRLLCRAFLFALCCDSVCFGQC